MDHSYRRLVIALKKEYPHLKVSVRRKKLKDNEGLTWKNKDGSFTVAIDNSISDLMKLIDTLIHEFAHCPAWDEWAIHGIEHGPQWGIESARCYRVWERINK